MKLTESKVRKIVREEIRKELDEAQQLRILQPKQLRRVVKGKKVQTAAGSQVGDTYQYELHFPNGEVLLIQNPDKLLFNEA